MTRAGVRRRRRRGEHGEEGDEVRDAVGKT